MDIKEKVLGILENITGTKEVRDNLELRLYDEKLLDSLGTVEMLVDFENQLGVSIPVSEFDKTQWATPRMIIDKISESVS